MGNNIDPKQLRYELRMMRTDRNQAMQAWIQKQREMRFNLSDETVLLERLAEMLSPLFEYIAAGNNSRVMGMRAWCLLYAVRPELIDHETFQAAAEKFGVSQENMIYHFARLKKTFPAFDYVKRATPTTGVLKTRMLKANAGRVAQQKAEKQKRAGWLARVTEEAA